MNDPLVNYKEDWRAGAVSALQIRRWEGKCRKIALDIECLPPKTRFSDQLTNLLSQEALLPALTSCNVTQASELSSNIDHLITSETYEYFQELCVQNIQSWQSFFDRHECEYREVEKELKKRCSALGTRAVTNTDTRPDCLIPLLAYFERSSQRYETKSPAAAPVASNLTEFCTAETLTDDCFLDAERRFLKEEEELRVLAHEDWAQTQKFNIDCAFAIQLARVDADWAQYSAKLQKEHGEIAKEPSENPQNRWQNKEKQALLVNTAPVFKPNAQDSDAMPKIANGNESGASAEQSKLNFADGQLRRQEKMKLGLQRALDRVEFQKSNAKKWIRRQALKMHSQLLACKSLHQCMAQNLSSYYIKNRILAAAARTYDRYSLHLVGFLASRPLSTENQLVSTEHQRIVAYLQPSENRNPLPPTRLRLQSPVRFGQVRAESPMKKQLASIRCTRGMAKQQTGRIRFSVRALSNESSSCQAPVRSLSQQRPKTTAVSSRSSGLAKPREPRTSRQKISSYAVSTQW